ncbi:2-dehydropantoate 2-reductase N-terminal domain-containing protein [Streptomyces sp. RK31]|uniref:ketopantoate reductase family protein n=1 Tax=Streptomyces sp. RK31 TaxID=2824892 RepID=UPI0027DD661B|nr:2-dehydropantoate 2-reductase N-terminal domain-containing protein [Streptomyces sp. RK31]
MDGADLVIVAVKLWDTEDVARQLGASELAGTPVLSLQNGVHKDAVLARRTRRSVSFQAVSGRGGQPSAVTALRRRCAAALALLPQRRMEHHWRARPEVGLR